MKLSSFGEQHSPKLNYYGDFQLQGILSANLLVEEQVENYIKEIEFTDDFIVQVQQQARDFLNTGRKNTNYRLKLKKLKKKAS